jgi:hypothetical protein
MPGETYTSAFSSIRAENLSELIFLCFQAAEPTRTWSPLGGPPPAGLVWALNQDVSRF